MFSDFCTLVAETHMFTGRSGDWSKVDKIYQNWFSGTNVFVNFFGGNFSLECTLKPTVCSACSYSIQNPEDFQY